MLGPARQIARVASLFLIGAMIVIPFGQVILREILGMPFVGAEELTRFMLICVVFITFPYVVVSGSNIRLEELQQLFPRGLRRLLHILIAVTGAVVLGIAAAGIAVATINNLDNATPTLGIPYWCSFRRPSPASCWRRSNASFRPGRPSGRRRST
jgi:TRAP-type C4-dicarboxylate transport system permease small subunit